MPDYESISSTVLLQTVNISLSIVTLFHSKRNPFHSFCFAKEILVVIWLTIELVLRVWSAGCRSRYQTTMGRLRFMKKPFCALGRPFCHARE